MASSSSSTSTAASSVGRVPVPGHWLFHGAAGACRGRAMSWIARFAPARSRSRRRPYPTAPMRTPSPRAVPDRVEQPHVGGEPARNHRIHTVSAERRQPRTNPRCLLNRGASYHARTGHPLIPPVALHAGALPGCTVLNRHVTAAHHLGQPKKPTPSHITPLAHRSRNNNAISSV